MKKVIEDVIKDFNKATGFNITYDEVGKKLYEYMKPYESEYDSYYKYAICMNFLYYLTSEDIPHKDVETDLREFFSSDKSKLLRYADYYAWIPDVAMHSLKCSYKIFELAKNALINNSYGNAEEAEALLKTIYEDRKKLDNYDYIYNDRSNIEQMYDEMISESTLDIDFIKGDELIESFRIAEFKENCDISDADKKAKVDDSNPFDSDCDFNFEALFGKDSIKEEIKLDDKYAVDFDGLLGSDILELAGGPFSSGKSIENLDGYAYYKTRMLNKIKTVLTDVLNDINRQNGLNIELGKLDESLIGYLLSSRFDYHELWSDQIYPICWYCIESLYNENNIKSSHDKEYYTNEIEKIMSKTSLKKVIDSIFWVPDIMNTVFEYSYEIFDWAKKVVLDPDVNAPIYDLESKYDFIVDAKRVLLDTVYTYTSKYKILDIYEEILAESKLDMRVIKGDRSIWSNRMNHSGLRENY